MVAIRQTSTKSQSSMMEVDQMQTFMPNQGDDQESRDSRFSMLSRHYTDQQLQDGLQRLHDTKEKGNAEDYSYIYDFKDPKDPGSALNLCCPVAQMVQP